MELRKLVLSAMFLAIGIVLPFVTGNIPVIGQMLLPMHIPVLLCGMICGWQYGLIVGLICPLLRSFLFSMPPVINAIGMTFELATYGLVVGVVYQAFKHKGLSAIYCSLITAMIAGRIVWGLAQLVIFNFQGSSFTKEMFIAGAITNAIPGIVIQLILIPVVVRSIKKGSEKR